MYEEVTVEGILNRMLGRVSDKLDKREGSIIADSLSPAAMEIMALYIELERVIREGFGDTASREFLILRCRERGISPYPAEKAHAKGVFEPKNVDASGKRFSVGEVNFTALEKLEDGVYRMECETAGRDGNRFFGEMIPIDYIEGLERAELTEILIPGEDEEDTEELRKRYFASFDEKAFGGNVQDYIEKIGALSGVGSVKVKRVWNDDLDPSEMIPSAAVERWYNSVKSSLSGEPKEWLEQVFEAARDKKLTTGGAVLVTMLNSDFCTTSDTLVRTVQKAVDPDEYAGEGYGFAPIGHIVKVRSAEGVPVSVSTEIAFEEGYGWDNLKAAVEGAVSDYLLELRRAWADGSYLVVRISQIDTRILSVKGVLDVGNTLINESADNLVLGEYQVPVLESVSGGESR